MTRRTAPHVLAFVALLLALTAWAAGFTLFEDGSFVLAHIPTINGCLWPWWGC